MFNNLARAMGGIFGAGGGGQKQPMQPQGYGPSSEYDQRPQGIGPSMAAFGGMMGNQMGQKPPVPEPPPTAQAPEAMGQAPQMGLPMMNGGWGSKTGRDIGLQGGMPQMGSPMGQGMGPSANMMQQMMQRDPSALSMQRKPPMMSGGMSSSGGGMGGWGNRGIQGPQQSQQFVSHPMRGSSYGGYR